ncbi:MAG: hypothetical protein HOP10_05045 [Chitinophagaceae bacterium]|nr:hypothetical protein [Chitinophagaceae bacterium]
MKRTKAMIAVIAITGTYFISCSKDGGGGTPALDCSTVTNKAFAANINPIVQSTCNVASCHAAGSTNGPGPLTTYTEVFNARVAIRAAVSSGTMPQGSTLTASQKNSIVCWIDSGAPNN